MMSMFNRGLDSFITLYGGVEINMCVRNWILYYAMYVVVYKSFTK